MRDTREVLEDHLRLAKLGSVEEDLQRNYAQDVVVFIADGIYHGHDGVRQLAARLERELPAVTFEYTVVLAERDFGFLEWTAEAQGAAVTDGADSYCVREGRIVAQTIHYTVQSVAYV